MKSLVKKVTPPFILSGYYLLWPLLGSFLYRWPSRDMKVIGITGTNGKTTVTHLATRILEDEGYKVASISSLRFKIGEREWTNSLKMTMPGRTRIQKFLRDAADEGCSHVVLEVTSEGIRQRRHRFIQFDTAVFTNLTPEHIESHGSFEKYREAKGQFFTARHRVSIVNLDDEAAGYFLHFDADEKLGYSITQSVGDDFSFSTVHAQNRSVDVAGVSFDIGDVSFEVPLFGTFNVHNALAAICIGLSQGVELEPMSRFLARIQGIPGRMELVARIPFRVVVDYAHTPDALEKVYGTISELKKDNSKMICVLGATGGGRDKWKRPEFGKLAAKYCDEIILTDEDPYDEEPMSILQEVEEGIKSYKQAKSYNLILDRREAIRVALMRAQEADTVIITGKGAEPWMVVARGRKIPWDDRKIVREELETLLSTHTPNLKAKE